MTSTAGRRIKDIGFVMDLFSVAFPNADFRVSADLDVTIYRPSRDRSGGVTRNRKLGTTGFGIDPPGNGVVDKNAYRKRGHEAAAKR